MPDGGPPRAQQVLHAVRSGRHWTGLSRARLASVGKVTIALGIVRCEVPRPLSGPGEPSQLRAN
eukprot:11430729-Alexandrium_andersonii.AAC.1